MMSQSNQSNLIIYNTPDGKTSVSLYANDGMVWMTQNQLAELFDTSKQNISLHVNSIIENNELHEVSVVKEYLTTADDGKNYKILHYSLEMTIAIGFRVKGFRGTQFRIWANNNLKEYLLKGFVMDDERLKNPDGRPDYFDELFNQDVKKVIVAVPERSLGASFATTVLKTHGFFTDWEVEHEYNLCTAGGDKSKVSAFVSFMEDSAATILICTHATLRFAFNAMNESQFNDYGLAWEPEKDSLQICY